MKNKKNFKFNYGEKVKIVGQIFNSKIIKENDLGTIVSHSHETFWDKKKYWRVEFNVGSFKNFIEINVSDENLEPIIDQSVDVKFSLERRIEILEQLVESLVSEMDEVRGRNR